LVKGVDDVSWDYYRRYANAPARSIQDQDVGLVLREYLSARLPDYMVPVSFVCLQSLPRTANGKLDRAALTVSNFTSIPGEAALESPRDPIEVNLVEIWERLLGARPVGIRTNFFDLGGHSLLVVRLFAQIDRVFHCSLPIAAIFESPTITQLATLIRGRSIDPASDAIQVSENLAKARCSVVPIKPTGTAAPLFIIHGILGNIVGFYRLAMLIGTERPVYGIQAQSLLAGQPALLRLEDQAAHYISEIRKIQPRGPYYLLGYCFGGMIALEIAQQLRAQGEQVEMLGLLDAYRRATVAKVQCNDSIRVRLHRRIALYLANFAHLSLSEKVTYLPKRLVTRTLRRIYGAAVSLGFHSVPSFLRSTEDILRVAGVRYRPRPWPGPVTLFRASDQPDPRLPLDLGWAPLAEGGVEVFEVPGDHYSIFGEPNIQILAERLHARLERSDACDSELCELAYSSE
jgi:thioesterase domain-containing protein